MTKHDEIEIDLMPWAEELTELHRLQLRARNAVDGRKPDWLICGGESGARYRGMDPAWANDVRNDCARAGVAYFFKQMAGKRPITPEMMIRQFPQRSLAPC